MELRKVCEDMVQTARRGGSLGNVKQEKFVVGRGDGVQLVVC